MKAETRINNFIQFCLNNGYHSVVAKDLHRRRRQSFKQANWSLTRLPPNFVNDKRRYYREEYLKSDHWNQLRSSKLKANPACERCGSTKRLDVHHLQYRKLFDVTVADLQTLCRRCHDLEHKQPT